ncbi:phage tail tip fiber protein [Actinobacillus suis]|uniref:phage tail tip fiber protein n=1 Tax=Actinobacillus suis TaxID=716 RepID=UPI003EB710B9
MLSVSGKVVTVDREITLPANSYFSYINAEAKHASIKISKIENGTKLTLETAPAGLKEYDVYSISSQKVTSRLYRCMTITEDDGAYTITALQHEPQKEAIVDNGASFEPVSTSLLSGGLQKVSNADVSLSENGVEITFDYAANTTTAVKYQVKLYRNGELYRQLVDVTDTKLTFSNLPDGSYTVEIRAKNERGQLSDPITRTFEINLKIPRFVTKSLLFAIELDWDLPKTATVGNYTEIWRASENDVSKAVKVATLPYPQNNYTINGVSLNESYYFFARCGDKVGNKGEFTDGVFGEADHNTENLVNALEGKITQSHLGKSLIESLKADIDEAVGEESQQRQGAVANALAQLLTETQARVKALQDEAKARTAAITAETNNRTKAIQAESASLTKKIQDEAKARGTAVTQLQQTDAQQAQLITAVMAKADQAIAGLQEEKTARANADKAEAQARNALTSRVASAESSISNIQSTKASKTEVASLAQQSLQAVWKADTQSAISNIKVGGRNLLRDSAVLKNSTNYLLARYNITSPLSKGDPFVITLWGELGEDRRGFLLFNTDSYHQIGTLTKVADGIYQLAGIWLDENQYGKVDSSVIRIYQADASNLSHSTIERIKLEKGTVATDWTPAPEDADTAISAVSADLTSYKQTQATKEQATSQQINGLTTRLASAESGISRVEKAVSDNQSSTATQLNQLSANLTKAQTDLNAKITQEQTARADADKANADRITSVTSRVASAESSISNIQSTKASKTEVASLAQQSLQAVWKADTQSAISNIKVGGRNLLRDSAVLKNSTNYLLARYNITSPLSKGDPFVITLWGELGEDRRGFLLFNTDSYHQIGTLTKVADGIYQLAGIWLDENQYGKVDSSVIRIYQADASNLSHSTIERIKLEKGTVATDWTPAPEDADSAINAVSSKVDSVQQTLTTANQALGSRIDTVTASVNDAKSQVSQVSKAVSDVSGKLSATSTLKTQVIAGGRKAIAGIALGAESDGVTTESSVIVMADKFGIVANANDGNVKPVFSVANGQVGIRGDLVVAGSVTNDKLSSGSGANLLQNPIFANNAHAWYDNKGNGALESQVTKLTRRTSNSFLGLVSSGNVLISEVAASKAVNSWWQVAAQKVSVIPGQRYCFSAYVDAWSCTGELMIQEWDATDNWVKDFAYSGKFGRNISGYSQSGAMEEKQAISILELANQCFLRRRNPALLHLL